MTSHLWGRYLETVWHPVARDRSSDSVGIGGPYLSRPFCGGCAVDFLSLFLFHIYSPGFFCEEEIPLFFFSFLPLLIVSVES